MYRHAVVLGVDREQLRVDLEKIGQYERAIAEGGMLLPQIDADACRVLSRHGYNFRSTLIGVIQTNKQVTEQVLDEIKAVGQQYGIPITVKTS